jgi:hypothetical protein
VSDQLILWGIQSSQPGVRVPSFVVNSSFNSCLFNYPVINLLYVLLVDLVIYIITNSMHCLSSVYCVFTPIHFLGVSKAQHQAHCQSAQKNN